MSFSFFHRLIDLACPGYSSHWLVSCFKMDRPSRHKALSPPSLSNSPGVTSSDDVRVRHSPLDTDITWMAPPLCGFLPRLSMTHSMGSLPWQKCDIFLGALLGHSQMGQWPPTAGFVYPYSTYMLRQNVILWWWLRHQTGGARKGAGRKPNTSR